MKVTWDQSMKESQSACARAEDLVAYLYQEATPAEARDFEDHLGGCASCRAELLAFGEMREAIGEWREASLGVLSSPAVAAQAAFARSSGDQHGRTALAALREFFKLSPVWMRAATAFAAILFCILAAIAVLHFTSQPKVIVFERPVQNDGVRETATPKVATAAQPNDSSVKEEPLSPAAAVAETSSSRAPKTIKRRVPVPQQIVVRNRKIGPHNTKQPPEEVIASADDYLPFTASRREAKLPSLVDLVDDSN